MKNLFLLALIAFAPAALADATPAFDATQYQNLIQTAVRKGDVLQGPNGIVVKALSRLTTRDTTKARQAEYFSAFGGYDSKGAFVPFEVSVVSEDWRIRADGNWEIEQWIWEAKLDGTIIQVLHMQLVETRTGSVLADDSLPAGLPGDAAELARWNTKLAWWYAGN